MQQNRMKVGSMQIQGRALLPVVERARRLRTSGHFCELGHCVAQALRMASGSAPAWMARAGGAGAAGPGGEAELYNQGITFTIYSDGDAIDRILPFDVIRA